MANLITKVVLSIKGQTPKPFSAYFGISSMGLHSNVPVKEIKIPVPWGYISGKLWGNGQQRPILALHGWQDNCGVWDPIAPMLCDKRPILAIDFPGHGHSSWLPPGPLYDTWDVVQYIMDIKKHFKWDKLSILGHSLGSVGGCRYAGLYPDNVDLFIAVENIVFEDIGIDITLKRLPGELEKSQRSQYILDEEPPGATMEDLTNKLYTGMFKSIDKENMHYLTQRAIRPSKSEQGKFCYTRDIRLKYFVIKPSNTEFLEKVIGRITCPFLYIRAANSMYKLSDDHCLRTMGILQKNNPNFERHIVEGSHHVHTNNPERLVPIIHDFMRKHKFYEE